MEKQNIPIYGARILFGPTHQPNEKRLTDSTYYNRGPFNFNPRLNIIKPKNTLLQVIDNFLSLLVLL